MKYSKALNSATSLSTDDGNNNWGDQLDVFRTLRSARAGEVFRGVALAPRDDNGGFWGNNQ